jgi:hypothetical protein
MWHAWRKVYNILVGKPEGKKPVERPRQRWEDGIRKDFGKIGWRGGRIGFKWLRIAAGVGLL